jgi:hypothetical protein
MQKKIEIEKREEGPNFPIVGVNGYSGEQDNDNVVCSDFIYVNESKLPILLEVPKCVEVNIVQDVGCQTWRYNLGFWKKSVDKNDIELLNKLNFNYIDLENL